MPPTQQTLNSQAGDRHLSAAPQGNLPDDYWHAGGCAAYAAARLNARPELSLGVRGWEEEWGGWTPDHFFAHADQYAYDSLGKHSLSDMAQPGMELRLNEDDNDWEEVGGADDQEVEKARQYALSASVPPLR